MSDINSELCEFTMRFIFTGLFIFFIQLLLQPTLKTLRFVCLALNLYFSLSVHRQEHDSLLYNQQKTKLQKGQYYRLYGAEAAIRGELS